MNRPLRFCALIGSVGGLSLLAADPQPPLKTDHFDRDPGWEEFHNRVEPKTPLTIEQDFGYSATKHAAEAPGEIGGRVQRCTTPSGYALALTPAKTLNDKFSASGAFALTACQPGAGLFFGFFNSQQPGGSGRPIGSLGLDFDFEGSGGRLAVRLITGTNKSSGTFATPYLPGKYRPTPIRKDGTRYQWTLDYDPQGAGGEGHFTFTLTSASHLAPPLDSSLPEASQKEARARFPYTHSWTVPLTPGYKQEGATFDRFGLHNAMKAGGAATIYFADLQVDGDKLDLSREPRFVATNNRAKFDEREQTGAHDFGYSARTHHAGGAEGEIGGGFWRSGDYAFYADRVGPLDLQRRLEARGKVKLVTAGPDSDMQLGWFSSASKETGAGDKQNFIGIHVGGPTRIGHYFIPHAATAKGSVAKVESGPIITPGKFYDWSIVYDPEADDGAGEVTVKLGSESSTLRLKKGQKAEGAVLDRFGLFTSTAGGQMVKIFLDDVSYTGK